jgi:hypothetical protein
MRRENTVTVRISVIDNPVYLFFFPALIPFTSTAQATPEEAIATNIFVGSGVAPGGTKSYTTGGIRRWRIRRTRPRSRLPLSDNYGSSCRAIDPLFAAAGHIDKINADFLRKINSQVALS